MSIWIDPSEEAKYGVAIYNYDEPGKEHRIKLSIGDTVHILKQYADWYYGHNTRDRSKKGIFPKSFIYIKEAVIRKSGSYETVVPKELPIVQEITSVMREWGKIWKQLFIETSSGKESVKQNFVEIHYMMTDLFKWRKRIMASTVTVDELRDMQQKVSNLIDMGNARLGLDLVVRDQEGNILKPDKSSTINLYKQHLLATKRIEEERESTTGYQQRKGTSFNLLVTITNFVCNIGDDSDVLISLYDAKEGAYISENYLLKWSSKGVPRDQDLLNNIRALFTDLGQRDTEREKVYIVCEIIRIGGMEVNHSERNDKKHKDTLKLKRPFGVAVLDVTDVIKGNIEMEGDKEICLPVQQIGEKENLDSLLKKVVSSKELTKGQGLWVTLRKLHGELPQVQTAFPHLVAAPTAICRKMGFTDVIMPDDVRNDLYVTICQGEFKKGGKSSDKNVEVTLTVCNGHGDVIENVIYEGTGSEAVSSYASVIYYHEDKPKWFETVKVDIPVNEYYGSHLKFTFKHRSSTEAKDRVEKAFAVGYIKVLLSNGTVVCDGDHNVPLYKMDWRKPVNLKAYLKLPSTRAEIERVSGVGAGAGGTPTKQPTLGDGGLTLSHTDSLQVRTLLCSTKLTQNENLMGLLKWRDHADALEKVLKAFMHVDPDEVVKFIHDVLDALFNIFMHNTDSELYDNMVFDALIFLLGIVSERKYHQFKPVLDVYIRENFSATLAYNKLMVVLKFYIDNVQDTSKKDSLFKAMRSLEYIFKFIIRSRVLFSALNQNRGKLQFEIMLQQVFDALTTLMTIKDDLIVSVQGSCLKYLPTTIADVITVFDPLEFSHILVRFVNSVPRDKLLGQKMRCCNDIVHSELFHQEECRQILLPVILSHVKSLMESEDELEVCIKILSDLMDLLFRTDIGRTAHDLSTISLAVLRTVTQTVIPMDRDNPLIGSCVGVMTSILRQMSDFHYQEYIAHFDTEVDLQDFLMEILMVFRDLVENKAVYPPDWNDMIMLQNSVFLKALQFFSTTIRDNFSEPFKFQLWNTFFLCAISFLTQDALQLERFSSNKRNKIISTYKDMRREAGFEIRSMWFNLGQHKINFIPSMVGPILQMTLIPETELRKATIPIFFDMMQCEHRSPVAHSGKLTKSKFDKFEGELITKLDELIEQGKGDQQYTALFFDTLEDLCNTQHIMRDQGLVFVETIRDLLTRLLQYRDVIHDENKENRMNCTVSLLNFYAGIKRQDLYVKYLHKLCDLHLDCDNFTEAAYTMMLYAALLQWSDYEVEEMLQTPKYEDYTTHRELKEKVYTDIIEYFDRGKMWEKGIELCKELAVQYENETYEYLQLSEILTKEAEFFNRIMTLQRPESEYFRVAYYGLGFPPFLQNKVFVYRGKEYERLSDFAGRLQNMFPNAQMMKTLNEPDEDLMKSNNQYLQINSVTPSMELKSHLNKKKVHDAILKYYKVNEVQKFTFNRKKNESNDMTKLWLQRTHLVISHPLPGILRWFPVTGSSQVEVSPLENAIETFETTNAKIKALIDQHRNDPGMRVDPLGMLLNGVVDAAVNGGIHNYQKFYMEEYLEENPTQTVHSLVKKLKQVTTLQLVLLQTGLEIHRDVAPDNLLPFQAHMDQRYNEMKAHIETHYGIKLTDDVKYKLAKQHLLPVKRTKTMPARRNIPAYATFKDKSGGPGGLGGPLYKSLSPASGLKGASVARSATTVAPSAAAAKFNPMKLGTKSPRGSVASVDRESSPSPRSSNGSGGRDSAVIVLKEELTPQRPKRPDSNRNSRPNSAHLKQFRVGSQTSSISVFSHDSRTSTMSTDSTATLVSEDGPDSPEIDEPPPLPSKAATPPVLPSKSRRSQVQSVAGGASSLPLSVVPTAIEIDAPTVPPKPAAKPAKPPVLAKPNI